MQSQLPLLPPQLAGYRLRRLLGRGAFGEVWEAEAPGGVLVAVKILHRTRQPSQAQRELEAMNVVKGLRHLYLLSLQAFFALDDRLFVVLELADGSLKERLRACRDAGLSGIPTEELLRYVAETAEALDYLHARKVLHRDIKPDNLLLVGGHVKVADCGLARLLEATSLHTASMVGTPLYMAPEVWQNKVNFAADQYALACTYAVLRTGRYPFSGDSAAAIMFAHMTLEPELELREEERLVLLRALAKDSAARFPTCVDFVKALTAAVLHPATHTMVHAGGDDRPIAPGLSHPSGSSRPVVSTLYAKANIAATQETDPGFSNRTTPTSTPRRSRHHLPLFFVGLLLVAAVGVLVWRTWKPAAPDRKSEVANDKPIENQPKGQAEADKRVKAGQSALDRGDFATAREESQAALRLMPGHAGATELSTEATKQAEAAAKKDAVAQFLIAGHAALRGQRFDEAVRAADDALKILPAYQEAIDFRTEAVAAQDADTIARNKREATKLVAAGRSALAEQKFADALRAADDAMKLVPGDPAAQALRTDTLTAQTAAAAMQKKLEEAAKLVKLGEVALGEKRFDDALGAADDALKILPTFKEAINLRAEAETAQKADAIARKKREATKLVAAGRLALAEQKFADALRAADDAMKLVPGDPAAQALRADTLTAQTAAAAMQKKLEEAAKLVKLGEVALGAKRFADALKAADDALKLVPSDTAALALKKEATSELMPPIIGRWITEQPSMGVQVKMDLQIFQGGKWEIDLSGGFTKKQKGTYQMVGDKELSLTFNGLFDDKEKTVKVLYKLTKDTLEMPNPNNLSEELKFNRHK